MMDNVMVDLETFGRRPGCSLISIGAVAFDIGKNITGPEFYGVVNRRSCVEVGLHEDEETLEWWSKQDPTVSNIIKESEVGGHGIITMLKMFRDFLASLHSTSDKSVKVWGNGSDFDNAILISAYAAIGEKQPWEFWNNRCYRTVKSLHPEIKISRVFGQHHNALFDAKNQTNHLLRILRPSARRGSIAFHG